MMYSAEQFERDCELVGAIRLWQGDYGDYEFPPDWRERWPGLRFRKDGWPDMRRKISKSLLAWAAEQERKAQENEEA